MTATFLLGVILAAVVLVPYFLARGFGASRPLALLVGVGLLWLLSLPPAEFVALMLVLGVVVAVVAATSCVYDLVQMRRGRP